MDDVPAESGPTAFSITVVVPVLNALRFLTTTSPMVIAALAASETSAIVYVDNGSTDGSFEFLQALVSHQLRVVRDATMTIAALRNLGASLGKGEYLSFLDADCGILPGYFESAIAVMAESHADATGCEVYVPTPPHWIERTLHMMHFMGRERDVHYINSANFFVSRRAFDAVHGFRVDLSTGEDSDIGRRLANAGFRMHESPRVRAIHYGEPHSITEYYRRCVWHGLGMFATVSRDRIDRPTAMLLAHILATLSGVLLLASSSRETLLARGAIALALQLPVPLATVAFRIRQTRRVPSMPAAVFLYLVYYWARLHALVLIIAGRTARYRK